MAPRQRITVFNQTHEYYEPYGRKLKIIWSGDTHQGESLESILEVGQQDTKKSKRTNSANFIAEIYREKNGEWLPSGSFSEHVTSNVDDPQNEHYTLEAINEDTKVKFYRIRNLRDREVIKEFSEEEW